jgi:3-hydroxybutyrate dehydrogenase
MQFEKRVVLVTGAGSGVGKAIAEAFAHEGAHVIVHDLRAEAREVAEQIKGSFLQADLSDPQAVRSLAQSALALHGHVDILVNNAGFQHIAPVDEFRRDVGRHAASDADRALPVD